MTYADALAAAISALYEAYGVNTIENLSSAQVCVLADDIASMTREEGFSTYAAAAREHCRRLGGADELSGYCETLLCR